jgi:peptidoglycan/xylan/chitin deacetylase (PgdA/CDA1 family)
MSYRAVDHLILSYHGISNSWASGLAVREEILREQLSLLRDRGYEGLTFTEWARRRVSHELPRRSVVVTFDDGYASTLKAAPILEATGFPGTVFPVVSFLDSGKPLCWPGIDEWIGTEHEHELRPLDWDQLAELRSAGWEVGSHTISHPDLCKVDDGALQLELEDSRAAIAGRLGRCDTIAYPYGHADERVAAAAAWAGYLAGCTLSRFRLVDEPYRRPRIGLYLNDSGPRLRLKLSRFAATVRGSRLLARLTAPTETG